MKSDQFEFIYKKFSPVKEAVIMLFLGLLILIGMTSGMIFVERYHLGEFTQGILILTFASIGALLFMEVVVNRGKFRRRGKVKISIIEDQMLLIEKDGKTFNIPISSIRSYSMCTHHDKFNSTNMVQWIIRYLPRKRISISVSTEDDTKDDYFAMFGAQQSVHGAMYLATNDTLFRKPNIFASKAALAVAWAVAAGFIVFCVVGVYLTGKFNIGILVLTAAGCSVPFMGLSLLRVENQYSKYTICNPHPK